MNSVPASERALSLRPGLPRRIQPAVGYMDASLAQQDIDRFLMQRYNWKRSHQFNGGLPPAVAEEKLDAVPGIS